MPCMPGKSQKHYLLVARISSLVIVLSGVIFAFALESVAHGLEIFWKVAPMLGIAFWMGLFWRRMNTAGAWVSTLAAFGMWFLTTKSFFIEWVAGLPIAEGLRFIFMKGDVPTIYLPWQMIFYLVTGMIAGVIASLISRPVDKERLDRFYFLIRTPVKASEVIEEPCVVPKGSETLPARTLIPSKSFEIYVPSRKMVAGFLAGWGGVALLIAVFLWLVKG